jgi:hypothetical protein
MSPISWRLWALTSKGGGEFFQTPAITPAYPSIAERTISTVTPSGDDATKLTTKNSEELKCFGCGQHHPWSKKESGKWVIICPNASKPGVQERAKLANLQFQMRKKKQAHEYKKHTNVNTLNWEDLPPQSRKWILLQQQALSSVVGSNTTSMSFSITGGTGLIGFGSKKQNRITIHKDIFIFTSNSTKPPIPIGIPAPLRT